MSAATIRLLAFGLVGLLLFANSVARADPPTISFASPTTFPAGDFAKFVTIGDFNGDGKPDLAVANIGAGTVSILLGTGTGTFGKKTDFATGPGPSSLAAGDFNRDGKLDLRDGKLDLAVANAGGPGTVSILLGDGAGSFGAPTAFAVASGTVDVVAADFDGDGKLDLATANPTTDDTVSILRGNGDGTFVTPATDVAVGSDPRALAVGDFNRDGTPDLAVATRLSHTVSVLLACFIHERTRT